MQKKMKVKKVVKNTKKKKLILLNLEIFVHQIINDIKKSKNKVIRHLIRQGYK